MKITFMTKNSSHPNINMHFTYAMWDICTYSKLLCIICTHTLYQEEKKVIKHTYKTIFKKKKTKN